MTATAPVVARTVHCSCLCLPTSDSPRPAFTMRPLLIPFRPLRTLALVALGLIVAGCDSSIPEPIYEIRPGEIVSKDRQSFVEIDGVIVNGPGLVTRAYGNISTEPPVVRAGVPFDVTVGTFGAGTPDNPCGNTAPSVVASEPNRVTIEVMDEVPVEYPEGYFCPFALVPMLRMDTVVLTEPGEAEVVVVGDEWQVWMAQEPAGFKKPRAEFRFPVVVTE